MNTIESLEQLGFTHMESRVYITLLEDSPATGYAIANHLGKPPAYIYRSLSGLQNKGAVMVEEGEPKLFSAVPYQELISQLKRAFESRCDLAIQSLEKVPSRIDDTKIYQLTTLDQVYERARSMISKAKSLVLADCYPDPLKELKPLLEKLTCRSYILLYDDTQLKTGNQIRASHERIIEDWPRQWLRLVVDGEQYLVALISKDGNSLFQAFWSANSMLSWLHQYSLGSDILNSSIMVDVENGGTADSIKAIYSDWWDFILRDLPPGADRLKEQFDWEVK